MNNRLSRFTCPLFLVFGVVALSPAKAATLETEPTVTFSKTAFADPLLEANQDRITDDIWISRDATRGIFNAKTETFQGDFSPEGTLWAVGTNEDIGSLQLMTWLELAGLTGPFGGPPGTVDEDLVLHIPADNAYYNLRFTEWGQGSGAGGTFTYLRSLNPVIAVPEPSSVVMIGVAALALVGWRARKR
ncbi:PEP-CTERM sorting domain-containing protein [Aeoliella sp.]|uniref:PEP-CTERM sorting domain-containing protein n=1 Tax=Aeoliella sp. TaxID=2795800 RepID=UPI003CCBA2A3